VCARQPPLLLLLLLLSLLLLLATTTLLRCRSRAGAFPATNSQMTEHRQVGEHML
jgi:hypothetical protein